MRLIMLSVLTFCFCLATPVWEPVGPEAASSLSMGAAPSDNDIIYVAGDDWKAPIFKSTDGGVSWNQMGIIPDDAYNVSRLVVDPTDPSIAFAVHEPVGWTQCYIYKTTDGGVNWTGYDSIGNWWTTTEDLAIHPTSPSIVYSVGVMKKVIGSDTVRLMAWFKSMDGGETWAEEKHLDPDTVENGGARCLTLDPSNADIIYVGGSHRHGGGTSHATVYKSTDAGENFVEKSSGLSGHGVCALAIHTTNNQILYAANNTGIFRSTDGGDSWSQVYLYPEIHCLTTSPAAPDIVYACSWSNTDQISDIVHKSTDAGITWFETGPGIHGYSPMPDFYDLFARSDDSAIVYLGTYTGFYKTTNGGSNWFESIDGLGGPIWVVSLGVATSSPSTVYISGIGLFEEYKTVNSGTDWARFDIDKEGSFCAYAIHNTNPDIVLALASS